MKKLLIVNDSLACGGKERRLFELLKGLDSREDYSILFVIFENSIHYPIQNLKNIKFQIIDKKKNSIGIVLFKYLKLVLSFKPEIIHSWSLIATLFSVPIKLFARIKLINSLIADIIPKPNYSLLYKISFLFSDFVTSNTLAGLKAYNSTDKKSLVIPNGFNFERIANLLPNESIKEKLSIDRNSFIIGMVATFSENKDYSTIVEAGKKILINNHDVVFMFIGAGNKQKVIDQIPLNIRQNFILLDEVQDIENYINIFDVGVLCSKSEGFSNSILEYMALKKPIIYCGRGGIEEFIENGNNGYLLKEKDEMGLVEKLLLLKENPDLCLKIGHENNEKIKNKYSLSEMVKKYNLIYRNYLQ